MAVRYRRVHGSEQIESEPIVVDMRRSGVVVFEMDDGDRLEFTKRELLRALGAAVNHASDSAKWAYEHGGGAYRDDPPAGEQ